MADRRSTITLDIVGNYDGALKSFAAGMQNTVAATNATAQGVTQMAAAESQAVAATSQMAQAHTVAATATESLSVKQTSLHEVLGTSRRETMFLEQSLAQLTGTSGIALHAFESLMTGIGPIGL